MPALERNHRVIAVDLLGHGGSEKPSSGYSIENQAELVAEALERLGVRDAEVVGHSLGGAVAVALAEQSPAAGRPRGDHRHAARRLLRRPRLHRRLAFEPVIGEALWRIKPDFSIRNGLEVAFAPGFDVPDAFVEDVKRMTYSSYDDSPRRLRRLHRRRAARPARWRATGKPLMVDHGRRGADRRRPARGAGRIRARRPGAETKLIAGAGHSPNVEKPAETARLVLAFGRIGSQRGSLQAVAASDGTPVRGPRVQHELHVRF